MYPGNYREVGSGELSGVGDCVCVCVCVCARVHMHACTYTCTCICYKMPWTMVGPGGESQGSGVAGEVEKQATPGQLEAHTLYGGEDMEGVCVCWDGFRSVFCDHHKMPSSDWFTRVLLF